MITSLVAYWSLDEASGTRNDSHGSNHLTDNNTVASASGKVSNAADFESGNSESLSRGDNADLSTGDIDYSFSLWLNAESLTASTTFIVLSKDHFGVARELELDFFGPDLSFRAMDGTTGGAPPFGVAGTAAWGSSLSTGTWYHVVCWHDAVNNQVGIVVNNGTPVTAATVGPAADTGIDFRLGADGLGRYFDGLMDEVMFWKKVVTSGEIAWLYNSGNGRSYADVVAEAAGSAVGAGLTRGLKLNRRRLVA